MPGLTELRPNLEPLTGTGTAPEPELDAQAAVSEASRLIFDAPGPKASRFSPPPVEDGQPERAPRVLTFPEWLIEMAMQPDTPRYERLALLGALRAS
jgi:hypothetical protein